jgi:large subunit ribosomal protein L35
LSFGENLTNWAGFTNDCICIRLAERAATGDQKSSHLKGKKMPKLKTKSGVKKRFSMTASGKLKHGVAGKRHRLMSHNAKYIRQNRRTSVLSEADTPCVKRWAPYGLK